MPETRGKNRVLRSGDTMTGDITMTGLRYVLGTTSLDLQGGSAGGSPTLHLKPGISGSTSVVGIGTGNVFFPVQAPNATPPAYVKGGLYFDTTLNKLMVGGAVGWETVTSA